MNRNPEKRHIQVNHTGHAMFTVISIIIVLFAVLAIIIPLLEKYSPEQSPEKLQRMGRWLMPLAALLILVQAVRYWMGS